MKFFWYEILFCFFHRAVRMFEILRSSENVMNVAKFTPENVLKIR